jgi:serine/threonine protein kinase
MASLPDISFQIGRFRMVRQLGRGAQGAVWLAHDPQLRRDVAIKTLTLERSREPERVRALLDEAVMVSRLSHPNIVTLFDAGQDAGRPYLVFEYVQGSTLAALLREQRRLPPARAANIAVQVLRALDYAHRQGVVHRDVKPANIMVADEDTARVMDFGIAALLSGQDPEDAGFHGTPAYMAPEYAATRTFTARSDVFAAGMVLYEMLTGEPAVSGRTVFELLYKLAHEPFPAPSRRCAEVDDRLEAVVMRALAKDPAERYESAEQMVAALEAWMRPDGAGARAETGSGTLEFLLRRMRHKSDFPALATTISAVNKAATSEREAVSGLSSSILKDFALTHKLLRLVNTAHFGQFGGTISTISRAIMVLGFDQVRSAAITLVLFEHLQNKAQAEALKDELLAAYFSGLTARELVAKAGIRDGEEGFICAMFHRLGRLLVTFYLHDEHVAIQRLVAQGREEVTASTEVLGLSYADLGVGVARCWNFPEKLVASMRPVTDAQLRKPAAEADRLRALASLSTDLADVVRATPPEQRDEQLKALVQRYGGALGVTEHHLKGAVQAAAAEIARDAGVLNLKTTASPFLGRSRAWSAPDSGEAPDTRERVDAALADTVLAAPDTVPGPAGERDAAARQALLSAGIQDITNALVGEFQLNDVLRIILETMYRGMGFTRVMLCIRDPAANALKARFGLGQDVDRIIRQGFSVPLAPGKDIFHAAISQGADIYIEDVNGERIRQHVPAWYRAMVPAGALALFPVIVNRKPVGLFYGDSSAARALQFGTEELALLKTLRNQAVLAIRAHQG